MIGVAFANVLIVTIFAYLSIYFNKWWLVLFSLLFLMKCKFDKKDEEINSNVTQNPPPPRKY